MADTRVSGLAALTGAGSADGDLVPVVDVSDTSMAATGTDKKQTMTEHAVALRTRLTAGGDASGPLSALVLANSGVTANTYGDATHVPRFTVNGKGLITAVSSVAITGGTSGGVLPTGWYDVTNLGAFGLTSLVGDGTTDNSARLRALIATIAVFGHATFIWPPGVYLFNTAVEWGERAIHNIGTGFAGANNFPLDGPAMTAGAANMAIFTVTGGSGGQRSLFQASPSFEKMWFQGSGSLTGTTGLLIKAANRCHLTDVGFYVLTKGVEMDGNSLDCAWHSWRNVTMEYCTWGLYSSGGCNSWSWFGGYCGNCGTGIELQQANSVTLAGIKMNGPALYGFRGGTTAGAPFYDNNIQMFIEMDSSGSTRLDPAGGTVGTGRTCVQLDSNNNSDGTTGTGNKIVVQMHGGSGGDGNFGVVLGPNVHRNTIEIPYQTAFADDAHVFVDPKLRNNAGNIYGIMSPPMFGNGAPGGSTFGNQGQLYINKTAAAANTRAYINTDGSTGWAAITSA